MSVKKYEAIKSEVGKLLKNDFMHEARLLDLLCNLVLVPKSIWKMANMLRFHRLE